jgi:hypothetical protein
MHAMETPDKEQSGFFRTFRSVRINPSDLLLEIISIVIAILFALAVNGWQEHLKQQRSLYQSLVQIREELSANSRRLNSVAPHHRVVFQAYSALMHTGNRIPCAQIPSTFARVDPRGFGANIPITTAWEIAQSTQAVATMAYDLRYRIAQVYDLQKFYADQQERFINLMVSPQTYSGDNCWYAVYAIVSTVGDIDVSEDRLSEAYAGLLKVLPGK